MLILLSSILLLLAVDDDASDAGFLHPNSWKNTGDWSVAGSIFGSRTEKKWKSIKPVAGAPRAGVLYNGAKGKTTNIVSKTSHGDVEVLAEFMIPKSSNSGIYFMQRYEVQILDSFGKSDDTISVHDCGAIYERWDDAKEEKDKGFEGTVPLTNASTAPGTWQNFRIKFRAPRFSPDGKKSENARFVLVEHNGVVIHQDVEVTGPTRGGMGGTEVASAPFTIQGDHGPVAFRKFEVKDTMLP
ncbi:DUF1080 domain-containing protein [Verrucomicrobiales bacterium]|nr:DUF1080 domain-containing protein [Verrucomicrobiales bacterium]